MSPSLCRLGSSSPSSWHRPSGSARPAILACDPGWLRAVPLYREPPVGFEGGVFRIDGFGDEYGGGGNGGLDFDGGEESGGDRKETNL